MSGRPWKYAVVPGILFGFVVSAMMMYFAWQHNPQGEIHSGEVVEWGYLLQIGASWFLVSTAISSVLLGALFAVYSKVSAGSKNI